MSASILQTSYQDSNNLEYLLILHHRLPFLPPPSTPPSAVDDVKNKNNRLARDSSKVVSSVIIIRVSLKPIRMRTSIIVAINILYSLWFI